MPDPRHILVIQTDAQHHAWLGFRGAPGLRTPHLDALARDHAVAFNRAYSCSGVCVPSRVSFMTGRFPIGHGVMNNHILRRPGTEPVLGRWLRHAGYVTGYFGKTHFAGNDDDLAEDGWDHAFTKHHYAAYLKSHGIAASYPEKNVELSGARYWTVGTSRIAAEHYFEPVLARQAAAFLAQHRDRRVACYVSHVAPHGPFTPPAPYDRLYDPDRMVLPPREDGEFDGMPPDAQRWIRQNQKYLSDDELRRWLAAVYGLVTLIDDNVGLLINTLKQAGLFEHTLIVFHSDHGDFAGRYGIFGKSWCMTDDLLRIPLLIAGPGIRPQQTDALVQSIDVTATLLDYAGITIPARCHGRSLLPLLQGRRDQHRKLVFACDQSEYSGARQHMAMVRDERWWYVESSAAGDSPHRELYDMSADPRQTRNLAAVTEHRDTCDALRGRLLQWHLEHSGGFFAPDAAGFWEDQTLFYDESQFCGERIAALDRVAITS